MFQQFFLSNFPQVLFSATVYTQAITEASPISENGVEELCSALKKGERQLTIIFEATKYSCIINENMLVTLVTSVKSILWSKFVGLIEGLSRDFPNFVPLYVDKLQTVNSHIDEYLIKIKDVAEANVTGSLEALKT
jgi:hypothetical protein